MNDSIISACLVALGASPEGGMPGLLSRTTLDSLDLLQSPGLWGHDPADDSYRRAPDGSPAPFPAASRRLLEAIEGSIASARILVDVASLEPLPSGAFTEAIARGLGRAAAAGAAPRVRLLFGRQRFAPSTPADFDAFLGRLAAALPAGSPIRIDACRMETSNDPRTPTWNHAKIVAVDGREAIVGGHNLWHADYLDVAPVHDLSARVRGAAAGEAHAFLDTLWGWAARQTAAPVEGGSVTAVRVADGRIGAWEPPAPLPLPAPAPGAISAFAVGRLGSGVLADARIANAGAALAALAFRQARSSIRMSQMDFGFHWDGVNYWSADVVAALADVLADPERAVEVQLILSEPGAKTAAGGPYSFGTTLADIVAEVRRAIGDRPLTGRMRLAPLRFSAHGDRWRHDGVELKIINHAKLWMVDDRVFHVGSDNLYPHNLQEFGYVIESREVSERVLREYWHPAWEHSARVAVDLATG